MKWGLLSAPHTFFLRIRQPSGNEGFFSPEGTVTNSEI